MKEHALNYARRGWKVFPVQSGGKRPAVSGWPEKATLDPKQVEKWWSQNPAYNIGIVAGSSGLVVIDIDEDNVKGAHGLQTLATWEQEHGKLPKDTVKCRTPRGGMHLYFSKNEPIGNGVNVRESIDIRADGGYVLAPPSKVKGKRYEWIASPKDTELLELDAPWREFIAPVVKDTIPEIPTYSAGYSQPDSIPQGQRTEYLFRLVCSLQAKGLDDSAIRAAVIAENEAKCSTPLSGKELEKEVFPALKRYQKGTASYQMDREYNAEIAAIIEHLKELRPEKNKRYGWHDAGNSQLFADLSRDGVCYVPERKKWYFFDGIRWKPDGGNAHTMKSCRNIANALDRYAVEAIEDERHRLDYLKHVQKWQQLKTRETILKDAATLLTKELNTFDSNPYLLNCQNGTLDLSSGTFSPHNPADFITKLANAEYLPELHCERWEQFIDEVTQGDKELAKYLQKALGYALTGDTRHECFFILFGETSRNGKGTLCETFMRLVNDYGKTARPESVAKRMHTDSRGPSEDIASLAGARFVNMSEPDQGMAFDAALVKTLTGNDTINARFLGENSFEFKPQFKMFVNTNYLPRVSDSTLFTSGRVRVIPFNRHFGENERDLGLKQKLTTPESLSGILSWCVAGWKLLQKEGFTIPEAVSRATQKYGHDSDKIAQFIEDCLAENPESEVLKQSVYDEYVLWCGRNGNRAKSIQEFSKAFAAKGIASKRKRPSGAGKEANLRTFYEGYTLINSQ